MGCVLKGIIGQDVAPEKGLFIGQHYALAGYGPLLMLLVTSENIRTALEQDSLSGINSFNRCVKFKI